MTSIRVLIVDDVEEVRRDLSMALSLAGGIELIGEACNGLEAVHLSAVLRPDVVLMDLEMPLMNGYSAIWQIKANHPMCRIIALTIHAGEAERLRALQCGADDFIMKGASLETLVGSIFETPSAGQLPEGEKE